MVHLEDGLASRDAFTALEALVGCWRGEGRRLGIGGAPDRPFTAEWAFGLDRAGRHLMHDYVEWGGDGDVFHGHGVFTRAEHTAEVLWFWFGGDAPPPPERARGAWVESTLRLETRLAGETRLWLFLLKADRLTYTEARGTPRDACLRPVVRAEFIRA